jgi:hypothetical protein
MSPFFAILGPQEMSELSPARWAKADIDRATAANRDFMSNRDFLSCRDVVPNRRHLLSLQESLHDVARLATLALLFDIVNMNITERDRACRTNQSALSRNEPNFGGTNPIRPLTLGKQNQFVGAPL